MRIALCRERQLKPRLLILRRNGQVSDIALRGVVIFGWLARDYRCKAVVLLRLWRLCRRYPRAQWLELFCLKLEPRLAKAILSHERSRAQRLHLVITYLSLRSNEIQIFAPFVSQREVFEYHFLVDLHRVW